MEDKQLILLDMIDPLSGEFFALAKALQDAGVEYVERDRTISSGRNLLQQKELFVGKSDIVLAKTVLREVRTQLSKAPPTFCPKCDGENIQDREALGFLGTFQKNVFLCQDCGHKWKT